MGFRNYIIKRKIERNTEVICSPNLVHEPLVSVRILSFNNGKHISQAVESVINQDTDFDFEIVIGDDCSTDDTLREIMILQKLYPRQIKILTARKNFKQVTGSHLANFVRTIEACRGEYVAMLDGDDYWTDENKLTDQVKYLRENYGCSCCFTHAGVEEHAKNGSRWAQKYAPTRMDYSASQVLSMGFHCATSSMMFRNEIKLPSWIYKAKSDYRAIRGILAASGWFHCIQRKTCNYRSNDWGVLHAMKKTKYGIIKETFRTFSKLISYHSRHRDECRAVRDNLGEYLFRRLRKAKDISFIKYTLPSIRHKFSA